MKHYITYAIGAIVVVAALAFCGKALSATIPSPIGRVNDYTNTLKAEQIASLSNKLKIMAERPKGDVQLVFAVVPDMQGDDIRTYSNDMFRKWGIGKKGVDRGVLFIVAKKERKVRMEVGYGMEPYITDSVSKRIVDAAAKHLAKGDYASAFELVTKEVDLIASKVQ